MKHAGTIGRSSPKAVHGILILYGWLNASSGYPIFRCKALKISALVFPWPFTSMAITDA
jgi:hypothetical protein